MNIWKPEIFLPAILLTKNTPRKIMKKKPGINFDVTSISTDPAVCEWFVFISNNSHLTRNVVTAVENLSPKYSNAA